MTLFQRCFLITLILLGTTACSSVKEPQLVSVDNVAISLANDQSYIVLTDLKIYNPNKFTLQSKDIKLELFMDNLLLGKIQLINDFYIKKRDTLSLKTKLILEPKLFENSIRLEDTINFRVRGSAKIPLLPIKHTFDIEHSLELSDIIEPILKENLGKDAINFKGIKINNIGLSSIDIISALTFKNNFNFNYTIEKLDVEFFDSKKYSNLIGKSSIQAPIQVDEKSEVNVESTVSLNTAKLGKSILKNLLKKNQSLFIRANVVIVLNQIKVPLTILKQVDYNPLTQQIKIQ